MADAERISRAQFRKEVLDALRAAGLEGPFEHDEAGDRLLHTSTGSFDLREAYDNVAGLPPAERARLIATAIGSFVSPPAAPATWEEARTRVMPAVRPRIALATDQVRRERGSPSGPSVIIDFTPHVVIGLVLRQSATSQMIVSATVKAPKSNFVALVDGRSNPGVFIHPTQPDADAVIQGQGRFTGPFESREQAERFLASKA